MMISDDVMRSDPNSDELKFLVRAWNAVFAKTKKLCWISNYCLLATGACGHAMVELLRSASEQLGAVTKPRPVASARAVMTVC